MCTQVLGCIRGNTTEQIVNAAGSMQLATFLSAFGPVVDGTSVINYPQHMMQEQQRLFQVAVNSERVSEVICRIWISWLACRPTRDSISWLIITFSTASKRMNRRRSIGRTSRGKR
jgi:hypothetical protein